MSRKSNQHVEDFNITDKSLENPVLLSFGDQEKTFINKVKSFFSTQKQNELHLSVNYADIADFFNTNRIAIEDSPEILYNEIANKKKVKNKKFSLRERMIRFLPSENKFELFWGRPIKELSLDIHISKQTLSIIQECLAINKEEDLNIIRQQIYSLPELCRYYMLSPEEIETLCYILYDCPYMKQSEYFMNNSSMVIARYLCKERRHLVAFSLTKYIEFLQRRMIVGSVVNALDALEWLNALSRMYQIISSYSFLSDVDKKNILYALYNLPFHVITAVSKGRSVDKTFLKLMQEGKPKDLRKIQEMIIISAVVKIAHETFKEEEYGTITPLLCNIPAEKYMENNEPVDCLFALLNEINEEYRYIVQSKGEYFTYALKCFKEKSEYENKEQQWYEVNGILHATRRIIGAKKEELTEEECYSIIKKLADISSEVVNFYSINPSEFFADNTGFYFSLLPLLAYMQYNKTHSVVLQAATVMKFIPLVLYKDQEKPYIAIQEHYNTIIEYYPSIINAPIKILEYILLSALEKNPYTPEAPYNLFNEAEKILYVYSKIIAMTLPKHITESKLVDFLFTVPESIMRYLGKFPEIFLSTWLYSLPTELLDATYTKIQLLGQKNDTMLYVVFAQYISPLSLLENRKEKEKILLEELYASACTIAKKMDTVLLCRSGYTKEDLLYAFDTLMPLYYTYPLSVDAPELLTSHVNAVLEVFSSEKDVSLEELCKKSKSILIKIRKNQ